MPFNRVYIIDDDPNRECWHEAGHAVVAHSFGMSVWAIGLSWVNGLDNDPNPTTWIATNGFDKEQIAVQLGAGMAAEVIKLGNYNAMSFGSDVRQWKKLQCVLPTLDDYVHKAIEILKERDAALVRIHERLLHERVTPSHERFQDDRDQIWKQEHLTHEEFEALCAGHPSPLAAIR
jgi:hypothetical protein